MNFASLSSLCSCYSEAASSQTMTEISLMDVESCMKADGEKCGVTENEGERKTTTDINGNTVDVSDSKEGLVGSVTTISMSELESAIELKEFMNLELKKASDRAVRDDRGDSRGSLLEPGCFNKHTSTHLNSFSQTHWHLYTQTPGISLFTAEDADLGDGNEKDEEEEENTGSEGVTPKPRPSWVWKGIGVVSQDVYVAGDSIYTFDGFGTKMEWKGSNKICKIGKFQLRTQQQKEQGNLSFKIGIELQSLDHQYCDVIQEDVKMVVVRAKKNGQEMQLRFLIRKKDEESAVDVEFPKSAEGPEANVAWISISSAPPSRQ